MDKLNKQTEENKNGQRAIKAQMEMDYGDRAWSVALDNEYDRRL